MSDVRSALDMDAEGPWKIGPSSCDAQSAQAFAPDFSGWQLQKKPENNYGQLLPTAGQLPRSPATQDLVGSIAEHESRRESGLKQGSIEA